MQSTSETVQSSFDTDKGHTITDASGRIESGHRRESRPPRTHRDCAGSQGKTATRHRRQRWALRVLPRREMTTVVPSSFSTFAARHDTGEAAEMQRPWQVPDSRTTSF